MNNVIKDNLEQNNTKPLFSYCKSKRQDNIGIAPLKSKGNLLTDAKSKAMYSLNSLYQFVQETQVILLLKLVNTEIQRLRHR